jgi:phosphatidylinositol kinase/protein kinase (PI-3  family)
LPPPNCITDPFKQRWKYYKEAYHGISHYKKFKTYNLKPIIVKANDDCRQEVLAIQLMVRL